ncbi:MAG: DUF1365 domain-containing protein [Woeseiaceae bacterium]
MKSCIYEGRVSHTRLQPINHGFDYRLFMMYIDLDELPFIFERFWFWSVKRPAIARFRRERHAGSGDLKSAINDMVEKELGFRPAGPVRLLTNFSYFGYWFNPVSFYYCFAADGETVEAVVVEVNNTPWGEQHCYVESCRRKQATKKTWRFDVAKKMHVSPFMPMDVHYTWVLSAPADSASVFMANRVSGERVFKATLNLKRKELSSTSLAGALCRFPFQTLTTVIAIHWQALRLWLKRVPIYPHPEKATAAMEQ